MYKLAIFDLDGTLADTSPGILNCIRYTQSKMNLPEISLEKMYSHVGPPMSESYNRNFGLEGDELKQAVEYHKEYAMSKGYKEIVFYDGIIEVLEKLREKNIMIAVATLKSYKTAVKIFEEFNIIGLFDCIAGVGLENLNTKSDVLNYCLKKLKVGKNEAVLIGDSKYDAIGASEVGIDFIAVTYGFGFKEKSDIDGYNYSNICNNTNDLLLQIL